jgi:hypothetical protein
MNQGRWPGCLLQAEGYADSSKEDVMTPRKTLLSTFTSAMLVFAAGATQVAIAESVPFVGNANLCAVDMSSVTIKEMVRVKE